MTTINPYLIFDGNCEEAFQLYKAVFGGEFTFIGRFKDMPSDPNRPLSPEIRERIMHISLPISSETNLFGSDSSEAFGHSTIIGNNFSISINVDSVDKAKRIFNGLSEGGKVKMPLEKTFWEAYFGMLEDKFGINWQVSHELKEHADFENRNKKDE